MAFVTFNSIYDSFICGISVAFKPINFYNFKIFRIEFVLMTNNAIFIQVKIYGITSFLETIDCTGYCVVCIHKLLFLNASKVMNFTQRRKEYNAGMAFFLAFFHLIWHC